MAEVQVSNWAEFVEAIAVSGDTVILPEEAEWNMAEILPYGLQSNVSFACRKIEGNGTRIKNLNLNSYTFMYSGMDVKYINNLKCTDWIGTNAFFDLRYGSEWFCCVISGITSNTCVINDSNTYNYSSANMCSCSINVEGSNNAFSLVSKSTGTCYYCRIELHAPNNTNYSYLCGNNAVYCELIFYAPNATSPIYPTYMNGCTVRGNLQSVTEMSSSWYGYKNIPCIYQDDTFNDEITNPYPTKFVACSESQMHDAAYLRSFGFPIIVRSD